ncbi:carboxypeptidase-like regulatory domain-containing protein [Gemmata sp. JC717]|uniref:Carboxypeptidase-like regulatory domain-containing protein n=1 Tax=Gemmata algarum TaxID=2975278 RepID=A0ABU5EQP4_9BACT|nr:carboxypeptidase-like regulatory domain-containing protein [Gemmata algarum]MDY3552605.1 carboxypeptidase-like regulatory domain-containing protein [Gemmata algarum]MDY3557677.1 carboxypeptidase-like regulatory domain-containing protein [Gemmata algarum]
MLRALMVLLLFAPAAVAADGKVSGTVTVNGKPLAAGRVIFHLDGEQFVGCKVKDGKYVIDRVPTGTRRVSIEGKGVPDTFGTEVSPLVVEIREGQNSEQNFDLK